MPHDQEIRPGGDLMEPSAELDLLCRAVIGAAIEVHRELGAGLPEEAYQRAMQVESANRQISFEAQKGIDVFYKGVLVAKGRIDLPVNEMLVVEIKSVEVLAPIHRLQALTYIRLIHQPLGLLINFNVPLLKEGIRRIIQSTN